MPQHVMQEPAKQETVEQPGAEQKPQAKGALSPQVREVVAKLMLAAAKIVYSEAKGLLQMIAQAPDPMQGIAMASKVVFDKIAQDAAKSVPPETIQRLYPKLVPKLGPIVSAMLVELAVEAGVVDESALQPKQVESQPEEPAAPARPEPKGIVDEEMEA